MENLNCYKIENKDSSESAIVFSSSEQKAIHELKESFDCETFEDFESYTQDNPDEFENEEQFDEWNFDKFYSKFPKGSLLVSKIEVKDGLVLRFSEDFYY